MMVRNYKRKTDCGLNHTKEDLSKALEDVRSGRRTARGSSRIYNIPLLTIVDHLKGRRGKNLHLLEDARPFLRR